MNTYVRVEVEVWDVSDGVVVPERTLGTGHSSSHYPLHPRVRMDTHICTRSPLPLSVCRQTNDIDIVYSTLGQLLVCTQILYSRKAASFHISHDASKRAYTFFTFINLSKLFTYCTCICRRKPFGEKKIAKLDLWSKQLHKR